MALRKRISAKSDETTGFGTNSSLVGGRLVKADGRPNIRKAGMGFLDRISWYHSLIEMSTIRFLAIIFISFLIANFFFAILYYIIGVEHLGGMDANSTSQKFVEAYFFSAQTFTTVGYGRINPTGYLTSFVAALEAFTGLLFFAVATGLFYARFSRPQAFIKFSHNALIAPYLDGIAFMCRMVPYKNNALTNAEVRLTLFLIVEEEGKQVNKFYPLHLEISKINALTLSWTLVHPINDNSPMYNLTEDELRNNKAEILVFVTAFDETFSNTVVARASYVSDQIIFGAKFIPMYNRALSGGTTILHLDKLNEFERVDISKWLNKDYALANH